MESITLKDAPASQRLLVAFAHPDDESFGPAGTIVRYACQGVAVHYVCGTRGEAGEVDPELLAGYDSAARLRTEELGCAAQHLGLTGLHFLDYHDSGMENSPANQNPASLHQAPLPEVVAKIARLIRQIRPQVVVTFDPSGGYFHPDHVKMHRATDLAFQVAGDPGAFPGQIDEGLAPYRPQKLYYTAFPRKWLKLVVKILPLFGQDPAALGRNHDIDLRRIAAVEQQVTAKIDVGRYFARRQKAARCYASQNANDGLRLPGFFGRWLFRFDRYTRAVPPHEGGGLEEDLFAGVAPEPGP
jgi:LmbE family N-acetylglucosaminyl deacetylase